MNQQNWNYSINSCGITECQSTWSWDTGKYPSTDYDLWTVLKGNGTITTKEQEYLVTEGTCMILRPGERYIGSQNQENHLVVFHMHFDAFDEHKNKIPLREIFPLYREIYDFNFIRQLLLKMLETYNNGQEKETAHWLQVILDEIKNQDRQNKAKILFPVRHDIQTLCRDIQLAPSKHWRLNELAEIYGYSSDYFGRIFSQITGVPFSEYVIGIRMNQARIYLRNSDESIKSIAEQLGYEDSASFCKQFKKRMGYTPKQYRLQQF